VSTFDFNFVLAGMTDVLLSLNKMSQVFQKDGLTFHTVSKTVNTAIKMFEQCYLRDGAQFGPELFKFEQSAEKAGVDSDFTHQSVTISFESGSKTVPIDMVFSQERRKAAKKQIVGFVSVLVEHLRDRFPNLALMEALDAFNPVVHRAEAKTNAVDVTWICTLRI
jgi:hypothetical protein